MNSSYNNHVTVATTWGRLKMTMSVSYTVFDGEIVSENRGGVESIYVPDTLGSTVAIISTGGVITDTFTYWPFGEIQTHVGSSVTPFTYVGTLGYYTDIGSVSIYVRARHYRPALTRWQTLDPLWPDELAYAYVDLAPNIWSDPLGLGSCQKKSPPAKPNPLWPPTNWPIWHPRKDPPRKRQAPEKLCEVGCTPLCWWDKTPLCEKACDLWCKHNYGPGIRPIKGLPNYKFCNTLSDDQCQKCCQKAEGLPGQQGPWSLRYCLAGCDPMNQGD